MIDALCDEVPSSPIFPGMGEEHLARVAEAIRAFYRMTGIPA